MKIKKVNGTYVVFFKDVAGKTHRKSTGTSDRKKAEQIVKESKVGEIEQAALAGLLNQQTLGTIMSGIDLTVDKAIEKWKESQLDGGKAENTVYSQHSILKRWAKRTKSGRLRLAAVDTDAVKAFINEDGKAVRGTRQQWLAALRSFFDYCSYMGFRVGNPARVVKRVDVRKLSHRQREAKTRVPFSFLEYRQLMGYLNHVVKEPPDKRMDIHMVGFWLAAIPLSYWTGLRLGDICTLEWGSFNKDEIVVWTDKRDKRVALPLGDPLIGSDMLQQVVASLIPEHSTYVFPSQRAYALETEARATLSNNFGRWRDRAGLGSTGKSFHCLRHSFVTRLYESGKTLEEIGRLVAHSNTETTEGYNTHEQRTR